MVSHHHTGSSVNMRTDRVTSGSEMAELESVYMNHPLRSMPRFMTSGVQRHMAGDSMLAYTEHVREFTKARNEAVLAGESPHSSLEVRAQHIPKWSVSTKDGKKRSVMSKKRRPLSLDELVGRPDKQSLGETSESKRRFSVPSGVPSLSMTSPREKYGPDKRVRISFVSAADLFDLVDFSLRSKQSRNENIKLARAEDTLKLLSNVGLFNAPVKVVSKPEKEDEKTDSTVLMVKGSSSPREGGKDDVGGARAKVERQQNTRRDPTLSPEEDFLILIREGQTLPSSSHKLKTRPRRAKRMKLHRSHLSAIPEDDQQHEHSVHAEDMSAMRMPIVPSSSSLAAIRSTRSKTPSRIAEEVDESPRVSQNVDSHKGNTHLPNAPTKAIYERPSNPWGSQRQELHPHATRDISSPGQSDSTTQETPPRHHVSKGDKSLKKNGDTPRNAASSGAKETGPKNAKVKAQKKFRKLIFLRDYPDTRYCDTNLSARTECTKTVKHQRN